MTAKHIDARRAAVREAIDGGSFGDAELDALCGEFGVTRRTLERDARSIREQARASKRAELHVLPTGEQTAELMPAGGIDWRTASREDGYVWMLEQLSETATCPRAIGPAKVGAIKTLAVIFDKLHDARTPAEGEDAPLDPAALLQEMRKATKGMPRKMRRELLASLG